MVKNIFLCLLFCISVVYVHSQDAKTLQECIDIAFENNLTLAQSNLEVERSNAQLNQSKYSRLPTLNGFGSHGYNWGQTIDPFTNQFATNRIQSNSFGLSSGVTLFSGFAQQNQVKLSEVNLKISELGIESNRNTLALSVSNAFLLILFNQELSKVSSANLESSKENLSRVQKLVEVGQLAEANLYQIQAQVAADEAAVIRNENDINLARLNLVQLIQLPKEDQSTFEISIPNLAVPSFSLPNKADVIRHTLNSFPEIQSAEMTMLSADLNKKIAVGNRLPRLTANFNLGTGFSGANVEGVGDPLTEQRLIGATESLEPVFTLVPSFSDFSTKPFFSQLESNVNRSFSLNLSIPIFNGMVNKTNIQLSEISEKQASLNLESVKNQLTQTVESAFADAQAAYNNYRASELSLKAQEEAFKYAKVRYEQQVMNSLDYAQARSARDAAQADQIRNLYDYVFKLKILEFYQGKPITLD